MDSVVLKVATIQAGANLGTAYISGDIEVIYAGGYSKAPTVVVL